MSMYSEHFYFLSSDDRKIEALFKIAVEGDVVVRDGSDWRDPTFDEIEEWDGLAALFVSEDAVEFYDSAVRENTKLVNEDIKRFRVSYPL